MTREATNPMRGDTRGATLVEFAFVAPVMLMLLMGLFDAAYRLYAQSILTGAMQRAGRDASLETGASNAAALDAKVAAAVHEIAANATWESSRSSFSDYTSIAPEPFTDTNSNNSRDPGECYSDINNNGSYDTNPGKTGLGSANDAVVYKMTVHYPRLFPIGNLLGWSNVQDISSTTILKNQPYSTQSTSTPVTRCT